MISPTEAFARSSPTSTIGVDATPIVAAALEPLIDSGLLIHGRSRVTSAPTPGALFAPAAVLAELERRYGGAGWATTIEEGTLTIERRVET